MRCKNNGWKNLFSHRVFRLCDGKYPLMTWSTTQKLQQLNRTKRNQVGAGETERDGWSRKIWKNFNAAKHYTIWKNSAMFVTPRNISISHNNWLWTDDGDDYIFLLFFFFVHLLLVPRRLWLAWHDGYVYYPLFTRSANAEEKLELDGKYVNT